MARLVVRAARPQDCEALYEMLGALAEYEKAPGANKATPDILRRDGFGDRPKYEAMIAELDGKPVGFSIWTSNYSTWEGRAGLFLEDIFVYDHVRGHGAGKAMLARLAKIATERGLGRIDLNVLTWNPARRFYEKLGINHLDDWVPYRVRGAVLERLAAEDKS